MGLFRRKPKTRWEKAHDYLDRAEQYKNDIDVKTEEYSELADQYSELISDMIDQGMVRYNEDPEFRKMVIGIGVAALVVSSFVAFKRSKKKKDEIEVE